jgi:hypothetical protein
MYALSASEENGELYYHKLLYSVFLRQQLIGHIYKEGKEIEPY